MTIRVKLLLCLNNEHGDTLKLMVILLCTNAHIHVHNTITIS